MATRESDSITREGMDRLKEELEYRKAIVRTEIAERIKVALSFGDLSENSEYDDAKQEQATNEARIAEIESILNRAQVIDREKISTTEVTRGATVTLSSEFGMETYLLVNSVEENIFENRLSTESPVGQAILNRKRGEVVVVRTPSGMQEYTIVDIATGV
ncbi:MAG: transcription elongation factor GreA [Clostridiaceae bacterium]|nr:transcription elongation factor GreA [Clostridiaceae bacterium]